MWVVGAGKERVLYGTAATPNEIDWVLQVTAEKRPASCPDGHEVAHVDTRAVVRTRRDGVMVGDKTFTSRRDPCRGAVGDLDVRGASAWAWNVLRIAPKKKEAP